MTVHSYENTHGCSFLPYIDVHEKKSTLPTRIRFCKACGLLTTQEVCCRIRWGAREAARIPATVDPV
jgi:hypothetical protein